LWNAILFTLPYIVLGYLLARWSALKSAHKWIIALWFFLFLAQGPIYTPLLLSAIVIVLTVHPRNMFLSLIGVAIAGYYASASRWTWLPAPATWAVLILLSDYKIGKNAKWRKNFIKLIPIGVIGVFGLIAGALASPNLFSPRRFSSNLTFAQPLLWYRLFPSSTYAEGILLGLLIAIGPLLVFLIWLIASKRWSPTWLQGLAYIGACLAFLAIGLTASVKIGGGNNLHNLDMLLVTLALISGLMLRDHVNLSSKTWPVLAQALLVIIVLIPAWQIVKQGSPLELPPRETVDEALNLLNTKLNKAQRSGEILFIDQRQLLTFNYVRGIILVSDYEKKFMMDQAMAGNASYFNGFYQDLASGRFSMIVTEPLYTNVQDPSYSFQEENNAWVKWIAGPLLCYYAPVETLPEVRVQLLVPRSNPGDCLPEELKVSSP
jgi:chromate transport protein ChrA